MVTQKDKKTIRDVGAALIAISILLEFLLSFVESRVEYSVYVNVLGLLGLVTLAVGFVLPVSKTNATEPVKK